MPYDLRQRRKPWLVSRGDTVLYDAWMPVRMAQWMLRHQHPASRWLHGIALPLLPIAAVLAVSQLADSAWGLWWRPVGLVGFSYLLQWIGHLIEGNDMGEIVVLKRLLRRPYVAVAPRYRPNATSEATSQRGDDNGSRA